MSTPWPRDAYAIAVWQSSLRPLERLAALAFADHAADGDTAWMTYPRLLERTGLASNGAVTKAVRGLLDAGWLVLVEPARQHRAARYRLTIPDPASAPLDGGLGQVSTPGDGGLSTASAPPGGGLRDSSPPFHASSPPFHEPSPPRGGADSSEDHSEDSSIDRRARAAKATRLLDGPDALVVAEMLATHGSALSEDDAIDCVRWVRAYRDVGNLGGYVSRFTVEQIETHATAHRAPPRAAKIPTGPARCVHGIPGGLRILGRGPQASRTCGDCDVAMPATEAEMLAQQAAELPSATGKRNDIDWEAAHARAMARDAATEAAS